MKGRKTYLIIAGCVLGIVLLSTYMKYKTKALVEQVLEEETGAALKYHQFKVSYLRSFPHVRILAYNMALEGSEDFSFKVDTLDVNLLSSKIWKNEIHMTSLALKGPDIHVFLGAKTDEKPSRQAHALEDEREADDALQLPFELQLDYFRIDNARAQYHFSDSSYCLVRGVSGELSVDINRTESFLDVIANIEAFDYKTKDLSLVGVSLGAAGQLHLVGDTVLVEHATLDLAGVSHDLIGKVALSSTPYFDLSFVSQESSVAPLVSLMPWVSQRDSNFSVNGELLVSGEVKGLLKSSQSLPAINIALETKAASLAFKNKPSSIDHMAIMSKISHPEGTSLESTIFSVDSFYIASERNYLSGNLSLKNLVNSPYLDAQFDGHLDFAHLVKVLPLNTEDLNGMVAVDVNLSGLLSDITNENYQAFVADGDVDLQHFFLKNDNVPQGLSVNSASFSFTPKSINLNQFKGKLGQSELDLKGNFSNYIAYVFDDKPLKGQLSIKSNYLDLDEFRYTGKKPQKPSSLGIKESSPFLVPRGLDLILQTNISKMKLDNAVVSNCIGKVALKDERLFLENLYFNAFSGKLSLTGSYDTQNEKILKSNLHIQAQDIRIEEAASSLSVLRKSLPISNMAQGDVSAQMSYYAEMDEKGTLDINSLKAQGRITSDGLHLSNSPSLYKLANQLKDSRYKDFTTSPLAIDFKMLNGQLDVEPFEVTMVDKTINAAGWYRIDNTINFNVKTTVKAKEIGGDVAKYVAMLSDANKPLPVTIILTGNAQNPNIQYDTREAINILRKDVTKNLNGDAVKSILKGFFK